MRGVVGVPASPSPSVLHDVAVGLRDNILDVLAAPEEEIECGEEAEDRRHRDEAAARKGGDGGGVRRVPMEDAHEYDADEEMAPHLQRKEDAVDHPADGWAEAHHLRMGSHGA